MFDVFNPADDMLDADDIVELGDVSNVDDTDDDVGVLCSDLVDI